MALDWDKLRVFHAAAEAGSFTHAAETLHLSQSAISRQVAVYSAASRCSSRLAMYFSASSAAMQPSPAAVTACR